MMNIPFNSRAASLQAATAIAAMRPYIDGYFTLSLAVGDNLTATIVGDKQRGRVEIVSCKVVQIDENLNEVGDPGLSLDTDLILFAVNPY